MGESNIKNKFFLNVGSPLRSTHHPECRRKLPDLVRKLKEDKPYIVIKEVMGF